METVKEFLQLYRDLNRIMDRNIVESDNELAMINDIESSTHGTDALQIRKPIARLKYRALKLKESDPEQEQTCQRILELINQLQGDKREIIYRRYILGEKWEDISSAVYLSLRRTQGIHQEALIDLERIWKS